MQVGLQVTGTYCGTKFSGSITEMRRLTVKTDGCFEFVVKLPSSMIIHGYERDTLLVNAKFDGTPSSYTKFEDSLQAA